MKIKVESHERYGKCRVAQGWAVAADVARILGYVKGTTFANKHVAREDKRFEMIRAINSTNVAKTMLVNERGVEKMVGASAKEDADEIRAWVLSIMEAEPVQENLPQNVPQVFTHPQFGDLRIVIIDGVIWFIGKDVAEGLGYTNPQKALREHVDEQDKRGEQIFTPGGVQKTVLINKSGLYSLILDSQLPLAKDYRHWVIEEVVKTCEKPSLPLANDVPQVFTHPQFGDLRIVIINGVIWFIGIDVARSLQYQNGSRDIERHVDERDRLTRKIYWAGQMREMILINKSGLYSLILDSQMPLAKDYRHWVTSNVLPQVDEKGFYVKEPVQESLSHDEPVKAKKKRRPLPEYAVVYSALLDNALIKIGLTTDFNRRIKEIRKETGLDVEDVFTTGNLPLDDARKLESTVKAKFHDKNKGGELYDAPFEQVKTTIRDAPNDAFDKLLALAEKVNSPDEKDKLLIRAANLI